MIRAAIAARITTCGLGSDTGGPTRAPAALTGNGGLRPAVRHGGAGRRHHPDNPGGPNRHNRDPVGTMARTGPDGAPPA
ncbi:amidase family protein, partial [Bradyrhizobium elkanii]|uniref:amidase family protein n=1 Tax=Bradyrhizobium elkanii TaxID=29448 RepID=UPI0032E41351